MASRACDFSWSRAGLAIVAGVCLWLPVCVVAVKSGEASTLAAHPYLQRTPECAAGIPDSWRPHILLHQISWRGPSAMPAHQGRMQDSWLLNNKDWSYKLWDEGALSKLVDESYPWFSDTYHALHSNLQREEVARYMVLHAHGGVYADLDIQSFRKFVPLPESQVLQLFEEPTSRWDAPDSRLVSNSLMSVAEKSHPLLLRILQSVRATGEPYAPTDGRLLQDALARCRVEQAAECGCYRTLGSAPFFPTHSALKPALNFSVSVEHLDQMREMAKQMAAGVWPPSNACTVRWGLSTVDPELGTLLLDGLHAIRSGDEEAGDVKLRAFVSSEWGKLYKYERHPDPPDVAQASKAYAKAAKLAPSYAWPHYEMGNMELEAKNYERAREHYAAAVEMRPSAILFHNNLGVCLLNMGRADEAQVAFRRVLELHSTTDDRLRRMAPEGGAHYNLGLALNASQAADEALVHIRAALHSGSSHFARLAAGYLKAAGSLDLSDTEVGLVIGRAFIGEGRTREASMQLSRAHEMTDSAEMRAQIAQLMRELADLWHVGALPSEISQAKALSGGAKSAGGPQKMEYVRANADGTTSRDDLGELTPELLQKIQEGKIELPTG